MEGILLLKRRGAALYSDYGTTNTLNSPAPLRPTVEHQAGQNDRRYLTFLPVSGFLDRTQSCMTSIHRGTRYAPIPDNNAAVMFGH
jgi:hypothetical protein